MRLAVAVLALAACKTDPAPPPPATPAASKTAAAPRRAKLPLPTSTNVLSIHVQLRAERAFLEAEQQGTPEAWDLAAELFARARDACRADCTDLAYSSLLARKNAIAAAGLARPAERPTTPSTLPARVEAMIDACDAYVASAPPGDPEAAGAAFLASQHYNDYGWIDETTTRFAAIVATNPTHDVALYSANLMLDAFNRSERYDDLVRWARDLQANAALMAAHPELAELVGQILRVPH